MVAGEEDVTIGASVRSWVYTQLLFCFGVIMKKIFISLPMAGKTPDEITEEQLTLYRETCEFFGTDFELIMSLLDETDIPEDIPADKQGPWMLGMSIALMAEADLVVFAKGWRKARGCRIEHKVCETYGISIFEL